MICNKLPGSRHKTIRYPSDPEALASPARYYYAKLQRALTYSTSMQAAISKHAEAIVKYGDSQIHFSWRPRSNPLWRRGDFTDLYRTERL